MKDSYDIADLEREFRAVVCHWQSPDQQQTDERIKEYRGASDYNKNRLNRLMKVFRLLGVPSHFWKHSETKELTKVIDEDETIHGVLYGYMRTGFAILLATEKRLLFIRERKGMLVSEEIRYEFVERVAWERVGLFDVVTLMTKEKDYTIHTLNITSADRFIDYVETRQAFSLAGRYLV